jgi:DNA-binding MarR family transcriptional regulator
LGERSIVAVVSDLQTRFDEAARLAQLLVDVARRAMDDFGATVGQLGLPVHLARAIVLLSKPAPMRDLADRLQCDRSYVTSLADQLEERGLVARMVGEDRRVKLLSLTNAGLAMRDRISAAVAEHSIMLRRLSDTERRRLAPMLEKLLRDPDPTAHI